MPLILAVLIAWAAGIAMLLSALFVRYRDIEPIWTVVLQIVFYVTPIFYTVSLVREKSSESVVRLMMCNPFAAMLQQARYAFNPPPTPGPRKENWHGARTSRSPLSAPTLGASKSALTKRKKRTSPGTG